MKAYLLKPLFWICFFFLIRLIGITNPPLEKSHNWRQVTGLMVARNYYDIDNNILYPRIDDTRGETGIIGMEFPSLNYTHYLVSTFFGYTHWYSRLINLIISSIGIWLFSLMLSRFLSAKHVLASTLFLLASIWFSFSRKTMPDTYCISLFFIGIYFALKYLEDLANPRKKFDVLNKSNAYLPLFILFSSFGILSKISAGIYFALFIPLWFSNYNRRRIIILLLSSSIPLFAAYVWYFIWNPYLAGIYGNWYNAGKPILEGCKEIFSHLDQTSKNFYFNAFSGFIVFAFALVGIYFTSRQNSKLYVVSLLSISLVFLVYIFKSGFYFYHHSYYIIPFVPVLAVLAGKCLDKIEKRWLYVSLIIIGCSESVINQQHDFFIKDSERYKLGIEKAANSLIQPNDLIAVYSENGNPQEIYLTHRKGWLCNKEELLNESFLNVIKDKGCKFIIVNKQQLSNRVNKAVVYQDDNYIVYQL